MKSCESCSKEFQGRGLVCSACRVKRSREKRQGADMPKNVRELTSTDKLFNDWQPGYYIFSEKVEKRECFFCKKEFESSLPYLSFCSPRCKQASFEAMNAELRKKGLPEAVRGSDLPPLEFVSSGIPEIDEMTKGFPRRRVTEIFGLKGVGKTTLMTRIVRALPSLNIYYVDCEAALPELPKNVDTVEEYVLERVQELVEAALSQRYDLIVVDSVASLVPRAEVEGDPGDAHMGLKARLMSQWMRRVNIHLSKSQTALVFINQQRETMELYGPKRFTPGGFALPYASSLRLELKSAKADRFEGGHFVHVEVEKSRVCRPYQKTKFKLMYE